MEHRNVKWHKMTADAAVAQLHTNAAGGLTRRAARSRLRKFGANTLFDSGRIGFWSVWKSLLTDPSVLLLLFSVFLAVFFTDVAQAVATVIALACGAFLLVRYTGKAVAFYRTVALYRVPTVFVLREGRVFELSARSIVPGDVVLLQKGDIVPADCRILDVDGTLCTRLVYRDGKGKRTALEQIKRADTVYPYESRVFAPNCENILYGKSEIVEGTVRAVVTEIGEYTYVGAMQRPVSIAAEERTVLKRTMKDVLPYLRLLSLFLLVLLIPMTVIGLLTAPDGQDAMRTFLPLGILCGLGAQGLLFFFFHTVLIGGAWQCLRPAKGQGGRSLPKSVSTLDKLADITDLIVVGRAASSDGVMHLYRAALGSGEIALDKEVQPQLAPMCEALELLFAAPAASLSRSQQICTLRDLEDPVLREELRRISQYDLDMLSIRLRRATAYYQADRILLEVEFRDANLRYCFTDRVNLLYSCTDYEQNGQILSLDSLRRANLLRFCEASVAEGGHPTLIIRQMGEQAVLLGILTCREEIQPFLPSVQEELAQCGVRVSYFLPNDDYDTACYAHAAKLAGPLCRRDELTDGRELPDRFADHRTFLGFSHQEIRSLIHTYKQQGRRFAVLGSDAETGILQNEAELRVACDPLTGDLHRSNGLLQSSIPVESGFFDGQYSRVLSSHANLLLPRANKKGGGLAAFLHTLSVSRAIRYRMQLLWRYLAVMLTFRIVLIFFTACFGTGLLSGAQLLWSGLGLDLLFLLWLLRVPIPQSSLRCWRTLDESFLLQTVTDLKVVLPPAMSAFVLSLFTFITTCAGWMTDAQAVTYVFYSVLLVEILLVDLLVRGDRTLRFSRRDLILLAILLLPPLAVTGLSFLLPTLRVACEVGDFSITSLIALPLAPILLLLCQRLAPRLRVKRKKR